MAMDATRELPPRRSDRKIMEAQRRRRRSSPGQPEPASSRRHQARRSVMLTRSPESSRGAARKKHVLADVQSQIASLSMAATERVLGQAVDPNIQRKLVEQFLAELGK